MTDPKVEEALPPLAGEAGSVVESHAASVWRVVRSRSSSAREALETHVLIWLRFELATRIGLPPAEGEAWLRQAVADEFELRRGEASAASEPGGAVRHWRQSGSEARATRGGEAGTPITDGAGRCDVRVRHV